MAKRFDVIVVGGGAMGTAAAWNLARRGRRTLILERFGFGHAEGSSGGPTRIFRYVYDVPHYAAMAVRARGPWDELQAAAGLELLRTTGGLDLGRGPATAEALSTVGVSFELLSGSAANERWPSLRLAPTTEALFQADGGVLRAADTVTSLARLAEAEGATLSEHTAVAAVRPAGDAVEIVTEDGDRFHAPVAVIAAGPWAAGLLRGAGIDLALQPSQEQVSYFALEEPAPMPTLIDWRAEPGTPPYLVPDPWEPGRFKVGLHRSGRAVDPDAPRREVDTEVVDRARAYIETRIAGHRDLDRTDTCRYTNTPDGDFVLDRIGPLVIASPCSGHGFKFVPLMGIAIADLATGTAPPFPLAPFRSDRAALVVRG
jgi:sarcosine oxidase